MFRREIKKQFNENKYNVLTQKGNLNNLKLNPLFYRCYAKILTFKGPLLETARWIPSPYSTRIQLHQALLHFPSPSQGRV